MAKRGKKKKYSDAMDALSSLGGGEPPAQQPPQAPLPVEPAPTPQPPATKPPAPQLPAGQRPPAPSAPPARPQQPIAPAKPAQAAPAPISTDALGQLATGRTAARPAQAARRAGTARRAGSRTVARKTTGRGKKQVPAMDLAGYNHRQTMIPILLVTGVIVLILAITLALMLPSGEPKPNGMDMPPHPMLAKAGIKWIVMVLFPISAGILFGAFTFIMQVGKAPVGQDQADQRPRRYDRGRPTRRR